jgi:hypothetical protein
VVLSGSLGRHHHRRRAESPPANVRGRRRVPDAVPTRGPTGWILIGLVPLVGWIVLLVFQVQDSVPDNEHGPNPKGGSVVTA